MDSDQRGSAGEFCFKNKKYEIDTPEEWAKFSAGGW